MNDTIAKIKGFWTQPGIASGDLDNALLAATARKDITTLLNEVYELERLFKRVYAQAMDFHAFITAMQPLAFARESAEQMQGLMDCLKVLHFRGLSREAEEAGLD